MRDRGRAREHVRAECHRRAFVKKPWGRKSPQRRSPGYRMGQAKDR